MPVVNLPNGITIHLPYGEPNDRDNELASQVAGKRDPVRPIQQAIKRNPKAVRAAVDKARYRKPMMK